ncbi:MAG TPA: pitrilysin family protein [Gemmatimonadales bacterium]|jgi:predicted Zn-dependent peptidase|nr:pitrilysin family protein [Gemmatimonadales bacterium]
MTSAHRWALVGALLVAAAARPAALAGQSGRIPFESFKLPNGLRVIYSEDHAAPIVTVDVWYYTGARNERPGRGGFAHLFEHMMFQGSAHVKKSEHFRLVERAGGTLNGSTHDDYTNYYETVPSNRLNLALWLEADRLRSLAITPENLENQRATVKEEKRLRVDNQPYAPTFRNGIIWPYDSTRCFPYAHPGIGSMDDLDAAQLGDVQAFFATYYAPNNATLVVTGDFRPGALRRLVNLYFADIPSRAAPPPVSCDFKFSPGTVRREVTDAHATLPAAFRFYRLPPHDHADTPALELLSVILGDGESARLNVSVVRHAQAALQAGLGGLDERRGPGVLFAYGIANQGVEPQRVDSLIGAALDSVRSGGVSADELTRAKNQFRAGFIRQRETTFGRAEALQHYTLFHSGVADVNTDLDRYLAVSVADLQRVARQYLDPANAVIVLLRPGAATAGKTGGAE